MKKLTKFVLLGAILFAGLSYLLILSKNVNAATLNKGDTCMYIFNNNLNLGSDQRQVLGTCPEGAQCVTTNATAANEGWCNLVLKCGDKHVYDQTASEKCLSMKHTDFTKYLNDELAKVKAEQAKLRGDVVSTVSTQNCSAPVTTKTGIFTKGLSPKCFNCGDCSQKDVFQEFVNIFTFILQISGSLAVLILVIGGIMYMTAAGDQQKTGKAKAALTAAVVGIIIVLTSFLIISFVLKSLGYTNADSWYTFSVTLK